MVKFGNIRGANKDLGRENKFNVFSLLSGVSLQHEGRWRSGPHARPAGRGREATSPLGPWEYNGQPRVQLWDPHHRTDMGTLEHGQLMETHQADWVFEFRTHRHWGNWLWAALGQEGQGDTRLPPAASQQQSTETTEPDPSQRNTGTGQHTLPACGNSQARRQEIVRFKDKVIYSEVDQTLVQVAREVVQSPSLEMQKAHLDKRPVST